MTISDLIDLVKENNNGDTKETMLDLLEVSSILFNNPDAYENAITQFANDNNLCGVCGCEIEHKVFKDPREYLGSPCEEKIYEKYCPNCNDYID